MKLRQWLPALGLVIAAPATWADTAPTTAPTPDALTVARDPATGRLRAPTAEEAQELARQRQAQGLAQGQQRSLTARSAAPAQASAPLIRSHRGGAASVRVTEEFASHSVVKRTADGKLVQQCVTAHDAANTAIDHTGHDHAKE